jgi:hypothetical protein
LPSGFKPAAAAAQRIEGRAELHQLQRGKLRHRSAEQKPRHDLVLRQGGRGAEPDLRIEGPAGDAERDLDILDVARRGDVEARVDGLAAGEAHLARRHFEALAGEAEVAADHARLAGHGRAGGGAADPQIRLPFGFQAHAGDEHLIVGAEPEVELPDAWGRFGILGRPGRCRGSPLRRTPSSSATSAAPCRTIW